MPQKAPGNRGFLALETLCTYPPSSATIRSTFVDTVVEVQMARSTLRLSALDVKRLSSKPGMYADGAGLYLRVPALKPAEIERRLQAAAAEHGGGAPAALREQLEGEAAGASWVLRYMLNGRPRYMGLGPLALYGLADARAKALDARRLRHEGVDPIDAKRQVRSRARLEAAKAVTFTEAAEKYIAAHSPGWKGAKVKAGWEATLKTYAEPVIGALPMQAIDTALVLKVLEPIWTKKPETAGRVRQRIEAILDWAKARGYREGENPARWRGHIDKLLPPRGKVRKVEHHAALPYIEIGPFIAQLRQQKATASRALEFAILTAARTGEALGARWDEINIGNRLWTVPAARMKSGKEHRVPLSAPAIVLLTELAESRDGEFVFRGARRGHSLSDMALLMQLRRMKRGDLTTHGFRSTFRDWAAERTAFPAEAAEMALAHTVPDKVEAAYRRGDMFEKRRLLMEAWAKFCGATKRDGNVAEFEPKGSRHVG